MKKASLVALLMAVVWSSVASFSGGAGPKQDDKKKDTKSLSHKKVTFVELGSVKCIPCKMMQPVMKQIEKEYGSQVDVVFHDVWTAEGEQLGRKYGIKVIPTQVFLDRDGKEFFRHEGYFPKEEIVKVLKTGGVGK